MHIEHGNIQLYDHYYLPIPNVISASFLIKEHPSSQVYYVAGLVWAGSGNGDSAYFDSMDSSLNLEYKDTNSNTWKPFLGYSSYGYVSTAETAQNIYSIIEPNFPGQALVKLGNNTNQNNIPTSTPNEPQTNQPIINTPQSTAFGSLTSSYVVHGTGMPVSYSISNGNIVGMETDPKAHSLIINMQAYKSDHLVIDLSRSLIVPSNQGFTVLIDGKNLGYGSTETSDGTAFYITFPEGAKKIVISGSLVAIPEFGTFASAVFLIGIITIIVISTRVRSQRT
jgi:hypothetical protein